MEGHLGETIDGGFRSPLLEAARNGGNASQVQRQATAATRRKPTVKPASQPPALSDAVNLGVGAARPAPTPITPIRRRETLDYDPSADIGEVPEWFSGLHGVPESAVLEVALAPEELAHMSARRGADRSHARPSALTADWITAASRPTSRGEARRVEISESPFFSGSVKLVDHAIRAKAGMTVTLGLNDDFGDRSHPLRGVPKGQRANALFCTTSSEDSPAPVYAGEVLVTWWAETPAGMSITLRLDDGPDGETQHPFECYPAGGQTGADFAMGLWLLEEGPLDITPGRRGFHSKSPTQQSQIMCNANPHFQEWAASQVKRGYLATATGDDPASVAAGFVRAYCGVESRKELGTNKIAAAKWGELLHKFETWQHLLGR